MEKIKIGNFEAICLILTIISTHTILGLPKAIISSTKSGAILNIIYISAIALLISYLIYRLLKNLPGLDIIDISEFVGGKFVKIIVGSAFLIYFLFIASVMLRNFAYALQIVYYPMTNLIFIILLFVIAISVVCSLDFNAIVRTNLLVVPIVFVSIIFLFIANTKNFDINRIFPIYGNRL